MTEPDSSELVVPIFESLVGQSGLHIHDPVEDVQVIFYTDTPVSPLPAPTDQFTYPVGSSAEISVSSLRIPYLLEMWVRNSAGDVVKEFTPSEGREELPSNNYQLEFTGLGMKIYARTDGTGFTLEPTKDSVVVNFESETTVLVGARSFHSQPARTITTSSKPTDLMRAVSTFGNAMKTWSPERTFPSLRGHPPLLNLDEGTTPSKDLVMPETGIKITVPAEHSWLYPVVPLAYWLGATVESGSPALHAGSKRYPIGTSAGYEADTDREALEQHVRDILQFTFFFDCAVRTEGFYNIELDARRRVEGVGLPLDFERLYEEPLSHRLQTYLDLEWSFEELAARVGRPGWRLTADVQPDSERVTSLPFLARDLAVVRCPSPSKIERNSQDATEGIEDVFARSSLCSEQYQKATGGAFTRASSSTSTREGSSTEERIFGLPEAESNSHAWIGDGFAVGAAKASTQSYLQRLEKHAENSSGIQIAVVVNDEEMNDEAKVSEIYGTRDHLAFDISVHRHLTAEELAKVFESDTDFIHYIGHVDEEGFDCSDRYLEADSLRTVGAETFVLNACASYEQGQRLVDRGAIAGIVTLEEVINSLATKVGKTVARLLNYGFPIGSATGLIQETIFTGSNYVVVGDSNAAVTQSNVAVPNVARVTLRGDGLFDVSVETFASWNFDVGSAYRPFIKGCDCHYVVPGMLDTWRVNDEELDEFFERYTLPVIGKDNLFWSDEISAHELRDRLQSYS